MFDWLVDAGSAVADVVSAGADVAGDALGGLFDLGEDIFSAGADALGAFSETGTTDWFSSVDNATATSNLLGGLSPTVNEIGSLTSQAVNQGGKFGILGDMLGIETGDDMRAIIGSAAKQYLSAQDQKKNREWIEQMKEKERTWQGAYYVPTNTGPTNAS